MFSAIKQKLNSSVGQEEWPVGIMMTVHTKNSVYYLVRAAGSEKELPRNQENAWKAPELIEVITKVIIWSTTPDSPLGVDPQWCEVLEASYQVGVSLVAKLEDGLNLRSSTITSITMSSAHPEKL